MQDILLNFLMFRYLYSDVTDFIENSLFWCPAYMTHPSGIICVVSYLQRYIFDCSWNSFSGHVLIELMPCTRFWRIWKISSWSVGNKRGVKRSPCKTRLLSSLTSFLTLNVLVWIAGIFFIPNWGNLSFSTFEIFIILN
jgi:hypothetical protein